MPQKCLSAFSNLLFTQRDPQILSLHVNGSLHVIGRVVLNWPTYISAKIRRDCRGNQCFLSQRSKPPLFSYIPWQCIFFWQPPFPEPIVSSPYPSLFQIVNHQIIVCTQKKNAEDEWRWLINVVIVLFIKLLVGGRVLICSPRLYFALNAVSRACPRGRSFRGSSQVEEQMWVPTLGPEENV
jgi:hypothetical protein